MSNECGPKFLTPANIYRFFPRDMKYKKSEEEAGIYTCIAYPFMQVKWATKLAAPTSCFSIHCWYIYMAIKESCHTTKCIYRTTTYKAFPCLRICLALYFPPQSSSMYLLCYDRRSGDDTCTDVWELNDCKALKKLVKFGSLGHVASKIQSYCFLCTKCSNEFWTAN